MTAASVTNNSAALAHRSVSANGIRFHLVSAGTGPLVLMLHGFGGIWTNWRHQLPDLAEAGHHAVAADLRGAGDSDKPPRGYDAFTLAADVAGMIRALGEREAILVGQGYGGVLAFNTAIMYPDLVRSVVAISAPHPGRMARLRRPVRTDPYGRLLTFAALPIAPDRRLAASGGSLLERIVRSHAGPAWAASTDFTRTIAGMRRAIVTPGAARGAIEPLRWVARSPYRSDGHRHREALARPLTAPVLHLVGEGDRFTPAAALRGTKDQCAGAYTFEVIPGVGHYPAEEAPGIVNARIAAFLSSSV
ncbi:Pimeloyl-ACP methyl ester carboxylesterase [Nakamurella panacisegetis]|uniref:Pimeloyl-ACP methyl ester carboxylesterase n=1 Tax=Nakamurella panacisegetis TaxID=1090615 RepID=A0A1H0N8Y9_9ACTN|nr:alpha/beta hydrolase [Nakamurella panacisegetis]SDO89184.1 Pimeloyl-ACP methyl ester carboxylesterase [Nakamurella panacisegetis]